MYKTLSAPLVVQIEATYRCPCSCKHCYNFWRAKTSRAERLMPSLSAAQMDRIVDQMCAWHVFHVVMTGGEPFINKRVVFRGIQGFRRAGVTVGINSNLIPLKPVDVELLRDLGISGVLTSILGPDAASHDAITQKPGSFQQTVRGIGLLQEAGVPVTANMVISQENRHLLARTATFVKGLGLTSFFSTRAACPGNCFDFSGLALTLDQFRAYLGEFHQIGVEQGLRVGVLESYPLCGIKEVGAWPEFTGRRCLAGVTSMTVGTDGSVRPCPHMDKIYGNLIIENLDIIWSRMQEWRTGVLLPGTCRSCKLVELCGGGCRMEAKMMQGAVTQLDPYAAPDDVPYVEALLRERKVTPTIRASLTRFRLNPKIRWRPESFGSIVFLGQRSACYLNKDSTEFLAGLRPGKEYETEAVTAEYGPEALAFLLGLMEKRVILAIDEP